MRQLPRRATPESRIVENIRAAARQEGWTLAEKTHGNNYQAGWPDLYCYHPVHGARWVEVKRPKLGRLTKAQKARFAKWEEAGVGIWVLEAPDLHLLQAPPNWRDYA